MSARGQLQLLHADPDALASLVAAVRLVPERTVYVEQRELRGSLWVGSGAAFNELGQHAPITVACLFAWLGKHEQFTPACPSCNWTGRHIEQLAARCWLLGGMCGECSYVDLTHLMCMTDAAEARICAASRQVGWTRLHRLTVAVAGRQLDARARS